MLSERCLAHVSGAIRPTESPGKSSGPATTSSTTASRRPSWSMSPPHYELKRRALACYRSQFSTPSPASGAVATRLTSPRFMQLIESRDAQFGALAGVAFAEGVIVKEPITRWFVQDRSFEPARTIRWF